MKLSNKKTFSIVFLLLITINNCYSINPNKYVTNQAEKESFPLASKGKVALVLVSNTDFVGVLRVVGHLQNDIKTVTGVFPTLYKDSFEDSDFVFIIGTLGKNTIIDKLTIWQKMVKLTEPNFKGNGKNSLLK